MPVDRRQFVRRTSVGASLGASVAAGWSLAPRPVVAQQVNQLRCPWSDSPNRPWLGAEVWANPMPDWRVKDGVAECLRAAPNRNVQRLTVELNGDNVPFHCDVTLTRVGGRKLSGPGSAGFTMGIQGPLDDYRNRLVFGAGVAAGLTMDGRLFVGRPGDRDHVKVGLGNLTNVQLRLRGAPNGDSTTLTLQAINPVNGKLLGQTTKQVPSARLAGNLAVTANYGTLGRGGKAWAGVGQFGFADWTVSGERLADHPERQFGPVFFAQYTLNRTQNESRVSYTLRLSAQLPPLAKDHDAAVENPAVVVLKVRRDGKWQPVATAKADAMACTATFQIKDWDGTTDQPYQVSVKLPECDEPSAWEGVVRKEPVEQDELLVADISCNHHAAFPNAQYAENLRKSNPDLLAFTGDQFYESSGGFGIVRDPLDRAILDYLHKWVMHGWTWRELTKDRPSVALPDDHDVYQGNIWGEGGAPRQATQEAGGYTMPADWVNVVHRTQTSHLPSTNDEPAKQNISVYFSALTYGGVSFALLADRMFKTGPAGVAPKTNGRADHVTDPDFDPRTADVAGAELLGSRQMEFLEKWVEDWEGAALKAVVSQTVFTSIATTHGRNRQRLVADYDTNAWPQSQRNEALRLIRKTGAIHVAGDQHLPAVVRYGIDQHGDAGVAFAGPAVNVGYPRWWEPEQAGKNSTDPSRKELGDFSDAFGHPMTMMAVFNPMEKPTAKQILELMNQKGSGHGLVRFNKKQRTVTIECYPYLVAPSDPDARQFPGWPIVVPQGVQRGKPLGYLPPVRWKAGADPLVKVFVQSPSGTPVLQYALRPVDTDTPQTNRSEFLPPYFERGAHQVEVSFPSGEAYTQYHTV